MNFYIETRAVPMDIPENVNAGDDTDDEYDHKEKGSLVHESPPHHSPHTLLEHTTPCFSDTFAGTSTRATHITLDDVLRKVQA